MTRKELGITQAEILEELDALRPMNSPYLRQFTAEQDAAILAARGAGPKPKVRWRDFIEWWTGRYGPVSEDTLRARLRKLEGTEA